MEIKIQLKNAIQFLLNNKFPLSFLYLTWGSYFFAMWIQMLYFSAQGDLTAGFRNIWGDWAMHISQVQSFTHLPFWEVLRNHPLYSGQPLTYPFAVNYLSAFFQKIGFSLTQSMLIPSIFLSQLLILNLYIFGKAFTRSANQAILAITIFFAGGGLGFIYYIKDLQFLFTWDRVFYPVQEYTHLKPLGYWWTNTLTAHLIPQRAFLLGMVFALPILTLLYLNFKKNFNGVKIKHALLLGLLTGMLAYIHTHTLIVFFLLTIFLMLQSLDKLKLWIVYGIGTLITCTPFLILIQQTSSTHHLAILPGWLANRQELNISPWLFWLKNWGLLIPVFISSYLTLFQKIRFKEYLKNIPTTKQLKLTVTQQTHLQHLKFLTAFILIFITANLIRFQPSTWDNAKIFLWVYLLFSFQVASVIAKLVKKGFIYRIVAYFLVIVLTFSGLLDLVSLIQVKRHSYTMIDKTHLDLGTQIKSKTTPTDLFLTSDNHLNWITLTTGNPIVLGYRGWIWSHGINYAERELDIKAIYQGQQTALQLIKQLQIDFVVIDADTKRQYQSNEDFFANNFTVLLSTPYERIYQVN